MEVLSFPSSGSDRIAAAEIIANTEVYVFFAILYHSLADVSISFRSATEQTSYLLLLLTKLLNRLVS